MEKVSTIDISMQLIGISGDSKATALVAIKKAKSGDFDKAWELCNTAKEKLTEVHKIHAEIIQTEAAGKNYDINTLYIHAQDHFTSAMIINDLAENIIELYELNKK
ncbi:PTS lactose/cellobiose transporter subunit IIA [Mesoplasma florum]|uniref:PTS lactose/cellobiose transporter subunit IIA n=1 Tax=Mesoplasma florum TaxID=2151 RepID=UPI000BE460D8|nr:PTS lactose/cellobiose transporter subunit IIA [Mesoplasma florum]ATI73259.1 PTS lactose/cellobiose transporter subunit IIA [Mesoplasma florum]AVN61661.1 PTS lactose/cellobiose transporter subunit IIA [Mesoplasma florum]AVN65040.1 PTS lactose/cellobiose transporter subunit IIA [Mesoplasma florum]